MLRKTIADQSNQVALDMRIAESDFTYYEPLDGAHAYAHVVHEFASQ